MIFSLLLAAPLAAAAEPAAPPLRRIEIVEDNNRLPSPLASLYPVETAGPASLAPLREYVRRRADFLDAKDPDVIFLALGWVSTQWKHDGMNEPRTGESSLDILKDVHEKGARYRCVEYGQVLSDILKSLGYVTRRVSLRSPNVAYGGFGQGHVATEVWSNALRKWIFIDPQFSVYPSHEGKFLNYLEMHELRQKEKWDEIAFNVTPLFQKHEAPFDTAGYAKDYKEFLSHYFGYVGSGLRLGASDYTLLLALEGKAPFVTFQGQAASNLVFAAHQDELYYEVNRTLMTFKYAQESENFQKTMERLGITDDASYLAQMSRFAAVPDFLVSFANNAPWHSHYEYRRAPSGGWTELRESTLRWILQPGENYLAARSVNEAGVAGPETFVRMAYR